MPGIHNTVWCHQTKPFLLPPVKDTIVVWGKSLYITHTFRTCPPPPAAPPRALINTQTHRRTRTQALIQTYRYNRPKFQNIICDLNFLMLLYQHKANQCTNTTFISTVHKLYTTGTSTHSKTTTTILSLIPGSSDTFGSVCLMTWGVTESTVWVSTPSADSHFPHRIITRIKTKLHLFLSPLAGCLDKMEISSGEAGIPSVQHPVRITCEKGRSEGKLPSSREDWEVNDSWHTHWGVDSGSVWELFL